MGIADTTGTELAVQQICFKEYKINLKYNGVHGHGGDRTYSISKLQKGIYYYYYYYYYYYCYYYYYYYY